MTKLVLAASLVAVGYCARWPHAAGALFLLLVLPLAAWSRIARELLRVTAAVVLPFALSVTLVQGLFYTSASPVIASVGPLAVRAEGLVVAYVIVGRLLLLAGSGLLVLYSTPSSDLALALVQRGLPDALAYIVVTALQLIPQMQARAGAIVDAQRARGLETEGGLWARARAVPPLLAPLVLGALADVDERAMALEARAFSGRRVKTSYRELPDSRAQFAARRLMAAVAVIICLVEVAAG